MEPNSSKQPIVLAAAIAGGLIGVAIIVGLVLTRPKEAPIAQNTPPTTTPPTTTPAPQASVPPSNSAPPTSPTNINPPAAQPTAPPVTAPPARQSIQSTPPTFRNGVLVATSPGDRVNVYAEPTQQASSPHYGVDGDLVTLLSQTTGNDNYIWYSVQFESGATGWIRGDRVRDAATVATQPEVEEPAPSVPEFPTSGILSGSVPGSQVNVRSAPSLDADTPHYGLVGDSVVVLDSAVDRSGSVWYSVQFQSGATGWVREDFVRF